MSSVIVLGRLDLPAEGPVDEPRATEDRMVPQSAGDEFAGLARHAKIVDIEAPHFLLQARPMEAARAINDFIRREFVSS